MDKFLERLDALTFGLYTVALGISAAILAKIYILTKRFFNWAGRELAKSAIEETRTLLVEPTLVSIKQDISSLTDTVAKLEGSINTYREEKHALEGEHKQIVQVIIEDDHETREILKHHFLEKQKK